MLTLVILQTIVVGLLTVLVIGLLRSHGDVLRRLHELGAGLPEDGGGAGPGGTRPHGGGPSSAVAAEADITSRLAPGVAPPNASLTEGDLIKAADVAGVTPGGGSVSVGLGGVGRLTMLAFLSSGCSTCAGFWQALREGRRLVVGGHEVRTVVVTGAPASEHPTAIGALAGPEMTVVMSGEAWADYAVPATPYFLLVDGERGVIGEGSAAGWPQLAGLVERALGDRGFGPVEDVGPAAGAAAGPGAGMVDLRAGPTREDRADAALLRAGIGPGDERLYQPPIEEPRP